MALRFRNGAASLLTLLVLTSVALNTARAAAQNPTGVIVGEVVDADDGKPLPDALVALLRGISLGSPVADRVRTDQSGRFVFDGVPPGTWTLAASKPGYQGSTGAAKPTFVTINPGQKSSNAVVRIRRLVWLEGRVEDDFGDPVAGVPVRLITRASHDRWRLGPTVRSDDRGVFRFGALRPAEYKVFTSFQITSATIDEATSTTPYQTTLTVPGGGIRLETGAIPVRLSATGAPVVYPTTFAPGVTELEAAESVVVDSSGGRTDVVIRIRPVPCFRVQGTVQAATGPLPVGLLVRLVRASRAALQPDIQTATAELNRDGGFAFPCVAPGPYVARILRTPASNPAQGPTVEVEAGAETLSLGQRTSSEDASTWWAQTPVSVTDRDVENVQLEVRAGVSISGRIALGNSGAPNPVANFFSIPVQFIPVDGRTPAFFPARPAQDLTFQTPPMPPGNYILSYSPPAPWRVRSALAGGRDIADQPFDLVSAPISDVLITLTDQAAGISGHVQDSSGKPQPGSAVLLFSTNRNHWLPVSRRVRSTRSTSAGEFTFAGVPDGEYFILAPEQDPDDLWVDPATLTKLGAIANRVVVREGQPVSLTLRAATIPAWRESEEWPHSVVSELFGGPFVPETEAAISTFVPGATQLQADVSGKLTEAGTSRPVRTAVIRLMDSQGRVVHSVLSNERGEFGLKALGAGAYKLVASKPGFLDAAFGAKAAGRPGISLVLQPGESRFLTLELSRGASISGIVRTPAGEPLAGATVRVLVRRRAGDGFALAAPSAGLHEIQVDESGHYRAFGLLPGEYIVGANTGLSAAGTPARRTVQRSGLTTSSAGQREMGGQELMLAPGFYPGVPSASEAELIRVSAGEGRDGIDITLGESVSLELSGTVVDEAGKPVPSARLTLVPADPYLPASSIAGAVGSGNATSRGGAVNVTSSATGRFQINGLTPRRYVLLARAGTDGEPQMAKAFVDLRSDLSQNITVGFLTPVQGTAVFHGKGPQPLTFGPVRVESAESGLAVNPAPFTVENGRFSLRNALEGRYRFIAPNAGPWFLAAARIGGHDVLDEGFVIQSPRDTSQLELHFTDTPSQVAGTLVDESGHPASDYVVVVFAADRRWWREGSRRIAAGRPRSDGSFSFLNLPAGAYRIAALTDVEQGEWFVSSFLEAIEAASVRIEVKEGQTTHQAFRIAGK